MQNIIAEIWNGNLEPIRFLGRNNQEMRDIEKVMQPNYHRMESILSDEQRKIFLEYDKCLSDYLCVTAEEAFCDGFSLAVRIMSEAIARSNDKS